MSEHEDPKPFGHKAFLQDERLRQLNELNAEPQATGRTVVVPVMTGDEAMSAFYKFLDAQPGGVPDRLEFFLAALRHAGVLK